MPPFAVLARRPSTGPGTRSAVRPQTGPNDLEPAALAVEPGLAEWRDRLARGRPAQPRAGRQRRDLVRRRATIDGWPSAADAWRPSPRTRRPPAGGRSDERTSTCGAGYLLRRWKRVRFSIFLCFFLRMRLRRFLISEPIARETLPAGGRPPNSDRAPGRGLEPLYVAPKTAVLPLNDPGRSAVRLLRRPSKASNLGTASAVAGRFPDHLHRLADVHRLPGSQRRCWSSSPAPRRARRRPARTAPSSRNGPPPRA